MEHTYILLIEYKTKAAINTIHYDDTCFKYATIVALNHDEIGKICKEN